MLTPTTFTATLSPALPQDAQLRWCEPGAYDRPFAATTEEALVSEMRQATPGGGFSDALYMARVAAAAERMTGRIIRAEQPVHFVTDLIRAGQLEALWVAPGAFGLQRVAVIRPAHYVTQRIATLPFAMAGSAA